jgi:glutamate racemase
VSTSSQLQAEAPIGVFDSGVGGLTVVRALRRRLPAEDIVYLGDTARIPYGTRSPSTVERYAIQNARFLDNMNIKLLVIACNTASALALPALHRLSHRPLLGVIQPGARQAVAATRSRRIGVIATEATVESGAYTRAIHALLPDAEVIARACPLLVALAEEDRWVDHEATRLVVREYLAPLRETAVDTLVLGCTHYPILKPIIAETMGLGVVLIDSGEAVAAEVEALLAEQSRARSGQRGGLRFFVTDSAARFRRVAERFLGEQLEAVEAVEVVQ